jgi:hypothetical protein
MATGRLSSEIRINLCDLKCESVKSDKYTGRSVPFSLYNVNVGGWVFD